MRRSNVRGRLAAFVLLSAILVAMGCGEKDKSKVVVARVGDHEVTLDYFERKMNKFPKGGAPVDFLTREGREEFLETIVNKEVMAIKAEELGMGADGKADEAAEKLAELQAVQTMYDEVVAPAQNPTEDELYDYYENFARVLNVSYMLFDDLEDAKNAKGLVEGGEDWSEVARRFDAGDPGPGGDWKVEMRYGTVADELEARVFRLPVGAITDPIETVYGYFIIRVEGQRIERVAPFDEIRDKVRASVIKQNSKLALEKFRNECFEEYNVQVHEDALRIVFDALPEDVPLTESIPTEDLAPLDVKPSDLDKVLLSYADVEWTIRSFADLYDQLNYLARPRRENRLGGLRSKLKKDCIRELMPIVARDRGYMERPEARDEYKNRREQQMVNRLYEETVKGTVKVSREEVEAYWEKHQDEFTKPERREALALVAPSEAEGLAAMGEAQNGGDWTELVEKYCIDSGLKQEKGKLPVYTPESTGPIAEQVFRMGNEGEVCYPVELGPDQWLVVKLLKITEEEHPSLDDLRVRIGQLTQAEKEEAAFQERVAEWKSGLDIEVFPDRLMDAVYDPAEAPNTRVPVMAPNQGG